jgi:hypothetical protein
MGAAVSASACGHDVNLRDFLKASDQLVYVKMVISQGRNVIRTSFENPGVLRAGHCPNKAYRTLDGRTREVSTRARH